MSKKRSRGTAIYDDEDYPSDNQTKRADDTDLEEKEMIFLPPKKVRHARKLKSISKLTTKIYSSSDSDGSLEVLQNSDPQNSYPTETMKSEISFNNRKHRMKRKASSSKADLSDDPIEESEQDDLIDIEEHICSGIDAITNAKLPKDNIKEPHFTWISPSGEETFCYLFSSLVKAALMADKHSESGHRAWKEPPIFRQDASEKTIQQMIACFGESKINSFTKKFAITSGATKFQAAGYQFDVDELALAEFSEQLHEFYVKGLLPKQDIYICPICYDFLLQGKIRTIKRAIALAAKNIENFDNGKSYGKKNAFSVLMNSRRLRDLKQFVGKDEDDIVLDPLIVLGMRLSLPNSRNLLRENEIDLSGNDFDYMVNTSPDGRNFKSEYKALKRNSFSPLACHLVKKDLTDHLKSDHDLTKDEVNIRHPLFSEFFSRQRLRAADGLLQNFWLVNKKGESDMRAYWRDQLSRIFYYQTLFYVTKCKDEFRDGLRHLRRDDYFDDDMVDSTDQESIDHDDADGLVYDTVHTSLPEELDEETSKEIWNQIAPDINEELSDQDFVVEDSNAAFDPAAYRNIRFNLDSDEEQDISRMQDIARKYEMQAEEEGSNESYEIEDSGTESEPSLPSNKPSNPLKPASNHKLNRRVVDSSDED